MNFFRFFKLQRAVLPLLLFLALVRGAQGQEGSRPTPPGGMLLNPAPAFSEWEIAYTYPQDRPDAKPVERKDTIYLRQPRSAVVTKTKNLVHEVIVKVAGEKLDRWTVDRTVYIFTPEVGFWAMYNPEFQRNNQNSDPDKLPLPASGFAGLDWVGTGSYAGTLEENGRGYLVFVPPGATAVDLSDPKVVRNLPTVALIDAATRLPAMVRESGATRVFTFRNPPSSLLTLPADLAADLRKAAEIAEKANRAPAKEY